MLPLSLRALTLILAMLPATLFGKIDPMAIRPFGVAAQALIFILKRPLRDPRSGRWLPVGAFQPLGLPF